MESILSIDVSSDPAQAIVLGIEGKEVTVLEQHSVARGDAFAKIIVKANKQEDEAKEAESSAPAVTGEVADLKVNSEPSEIVSQSPLSSLLSLIKTPWTNAILVIPPHDFLSLNLELPFNDPKSLNRVLDLEVQDLVPFEVGDFFLAPRSVSKALENGAETKSSRHDIHVGILPRTYIKRVIEECKKASFEPVIVTTPASTLGAVYQLAPQYFSANSAIIFETMPSYLMICSVDGSLRTTKNFTHPSFASETNGSSPNLNISESNVQLLRDIKLALTATERRYGIIFEKVYYSGRNFNASDLQQSLGRSVESLNIDELIPISDNPSAVPSLAAIYAQDTHIPLVLNNFRVKEFAYRPQLKELIRGAKALAPFVVTFFIALMIYYTCYFAVGVWQISRLSSSMRNQIISAIPSLQSESGQEMQALLTEKAALEDQLKDISTLSEHTPLELFAEVAKDFPESRGVTINAIKIRDNKITVDGSVKNYSDRDELLKALNNKPLYEKVTKTDTNSGYTTGPGLISFSFEIIVKE